MRRRQPLPKVWLMTDPRFGDDLISAIRKLPFGSGVIFRHYHLTIEERHKLFHKVARTCRQRGHTVLLAGSERDALRWHADGFHQRSTKTSTLIHSSPVHNRSELVRARRQNTDMILISPVYTTASHSGVRPLSRFSFNRLAAQAYNMQVIALGGVTKRKALALNSHLVFGWAAIDAFRKTSN